MLPHVCLIANLILVCVQVGLEQGLEMLDIFKSYPSKTSLIDDLSFYESREKLLKARRIAKLAFQPEVNIAIVYLLLVLTRLSINWWVGALVLKIAPVNKSTIQ